MREQQAHQPSVARLGRAHGSSAGLWNHCIVKIVRVSVFSLARAFGLAPWSAGS
jgi:hypothetical protein